MPDEVLLRSRKFSVARRFVTRGEATHPYDVILHPGAVVILPLLSDGRIVLIHNRRPAVGRELLELPAGTLDPGEAPAVCAARELAEETGYRAGRLTPLLEFYTTPGMTDERMHAFVATELVPGDAAPEETEEIRVVPSSRAEVLAGIADGRIVDAKTVATVLFFERFGAVRGG